MSLIPPCATHICHYPCTSCFIQSWWLASLIRAQPAGLLYALRETFAVREQQSSVTSNNSSGVGAVLPELSHSVPGWRMPGLPAVWVRLALAKHRLFPSQSRQISPSSMPCFSGRSTWALLRGLVAIPDPLSVPRSRLRVLAARTPYALLSFLRSSPATPPRIPRLRCHLRSQRPSADLIPMPALQLTVGSSHLSPARDTLARRVVVTSQVSRSR